MRIISYGEPSLFGDPIVLFSRGRRRCSDCDCDDCDDNCEYYFMCDGCPQHGTGCPEFDDSCDCYYD